MCEAPIHDARIASSINAHSLIRSLHQHGISALETSSATAADPLLLAPLHILHHKSFPAACGIAFHGAEPIFRLVVAPPKKNSVESAPCDVSPSPLSQSPPSRYVYQVGTHLVFEPPAVFCTCAAFRFQVANKQDMLLCKHILALQLVLSSQGNTCQQQSVRDRLISEDEFIQAICSVSGSR